MDFRKCPACQASVLEDDVEDCPFCGASMSGKPKPKADPSKTKQPSNSGEKRSDPKGSVPTSKSSPKKKTAPKATESSGEDDPFEVDTSAVRKAIKLSPRPTKSRTYEIVCPMCETRGFMPASEAGKDVQCANPECIVPVFKSKRPKVEAPPEEEPKSKKGLIIGVSVVALLAIGVGVFMMMNGEDPKVVTDDNPLPMPGPIGVEECDDCPPVECDDCKPTQISLAEIKEQSKTKVVDAARDRGDHNRNVGTQLAAETLAVAGDLDAANSELKRLQSAGRATGYLQIQPFAEIAWEQLRRGDIEAATKSATDGLARANNLPPTVRRSLDSVISLAAVLTAVGKKDEAVQLIAEQIADAEGDVGTRGDASVLWRTSLDSGTYDIGLESSRPYHVLMPESLRIGMIETLVSHGYPDEAWTLIETARQVASQDACRAAWAGRVAEMNPQSASQTVQEAITGQDISATGRTRVWAAVASHLKHHNQADQAQVAFDKALAAAEGMDAPKPVKALSMKQIYESQGKAYLGLENPSQEESSAMACADISLVSVQFGQTGQAVGFLEKSMAYARATTPSPARTLELFNECENQEGQVKRKLQNELNIGSSAPEVRSAFNRYRRQCERFNTMAFERLRKQVVLLRAMAHAGLRKEVWMYVLARSKEQDIQSRESLLDTTLPGLAIVLADLNLENELKKEILDTKENRVEIDIVDRGIGQAVADFLQGNWKNSGETLREFYKSKSMKGDRDRADIGALGLICDVMRQQSTVETFEYLVTLSDPVLRQDGFMLFASYTAQQGAAHELWEHLKTPAIRELDALDKAAIYRGFVTGASERKSAPVTGE